MEQGLLRKEEVAAILGTTPRHVMDLARRGELPSVKVGRLVRFRSEHIERYIEEQVNERVAQ